MKRQTRKVVFKEFNFGQTIEIKKGNILYAGFVDTYRVTPFFTDFDECLAKARDVVWKPLPEIM